MTIMEMYLALAVIVIAIAFGMGIYAGIRTDIEIKRIDKEWEELHKDETV